MLILLKPVKLGFRLKLKAIFLTLFLLFSLSGNAAVPETPISVVAFGSCATQDRPQPVWYEIIAQKPDLFILAGDNIYADTESMEVMRSKYAQLGAQPGYQKLLNTCPILATWDDHDYGVNDGGAEYPKKAESQREFLSFFQIPKSSPRWKRPGIYGAELFGPPEKRVQVILLDTRYFRSPLKTGPEPRTHKDKGPYVPNYDPKATVLGEAQWEWLETQLQKPAAIRILTSSIQVIPEEHGWEMWANFPLERNRLLRLIRDKRVGGLVIISGDRHLAEISRLEKNEQNGVGYSLYEVTSSGLNRGTGRFGKDEENYHRVTPNNFRLPNFGLIRIDWEQEDPLIHLEIRDGAGQIALRHEVRLSEIRPWSDRK